MHSLCNLGSARAASVPERNIIDIGAKVSAASYPLAIRMHGHEDKVSAASYPLAIRMHGHEDKVSAASYPLAIRMHGHEDKVSATSYPLAIRMHRHEDKIKLGTRLKVGSGNSWERGYEAIKQEITHLLLLNNGDL